MTEFLPHGMMLSTSEHTRVLYLGIHNDHTAWVEQLWSSGTMIITLWDRYDVHQRRTDKRHLALYCVGQARVIR